jgi:nicotinate phosphoribosyltransferase
LIPVMSKGEVVYHCPPLSQVREKALQEMQRFHPSVRRFLYPELYLSGLERSLYEKKLQLIEESKR